ncbi:MAG: hypothetical protein GAK38_02774 [Xylophilus sp.]|nr:MAG: hypothetical protein GAK38_02774 [Xylophilus sp.]
MRLANLADAVARAAAVRARLAFDADPHAFRTRHAKQQHALAAPLAAARAVGAGPIVKPPAPAGPRRRRPGRVGSDKKA